MAKKKPTDTPEADAATPETRKRDLPKLQSPTAKIAPLLAPLPGGGMIGVQGFAF